MQVAAEVALGEFLGLRQGQLSVGASTTIGSYLVPRVYGRTLNLPPVIVLIAMLISSTVFRWVPPLKWVAPWEDLGRNMQIMIVPALLLGLQPMAIIMRMTRATMLEVLGHDYVRTARAKGLRNRIVVYRHALRNALIPVVTVIGFQLGALMGSSAIIEVIFGLNGVGNTLLLNGRTYSPPYVVTAIGDSAAMQAALSASPLVKSSSV